MSRRFAARVSGIVATVVLLGVTAAPASQAHPGSTYYPTKWSVGSSVFYRFEQGFPGGAWRDRVKNGASQWYSAAGTAEPRLIWAGGADITPIGFTTSCSNSNFRGPNVMHYESLDFVGTGVAGATYVCYDVNTREIGSFQLAFDSSGRNWYTGTGVPGAPVGGVCQPELGCQMDAFSVAAHEFGHSLGMTSVGGHPGHYDEADQSLCPDPSPTSWATATGRQTMCAGGYPGTNEMRSLESHDKHTFQGAY